jgi:hypothetical protein
MFGFVTSTQPTRLAIALARNKITSLVVYLALEVLHSVDPFVLEVSVVG